MNPDLIGVPVLSFAVFYFAVLSFVSSIPDRSSQYSPRRTCESKRCHAWRAPSWCILVSGFLRIFHIASIQIPPSTEQLVEIVGPVLRFQEQIHISIRTNIPTSDVGA